MILEVPVPTPERTPDVDPIVAAEVTLLVQVPPDTALVNVVVDPAQTVLAPLIAATELMVSTSVAWQPVVAV